MSLLSVEGIVFVKILASHLTGSLLMNAYINAAVQKGRVPGIPGCKDHIGRLIGWSKMGEQRRSGRRLVRPCQRLCIHWVVLDHVMWLFKKRFPRKEPPCREMRKKCCKLLLYKQERKRKKKKHLLHLYSVFISVWNICEKKKKTWEFAEPHYCLTT